MTTTIPVSFNCKACGTKLTWDDNATDTTEIFCKKCGKRFGTYADLRNAAMGAVKDKVESVIKDAFKNDH